MAAVNNSSPLPRFLLKPNSLKSRLDKITQQRDSIARVFQDKFEVTRTLSQYYKDSNTQLNILKFKFTLLDSNNAFAIKEFKEAYMVFFDTLEKFISENKNTYIHFEQDTPPELGDLHDSISSFLSIADYLLSDLAYRLLCRDYSQLDAEATLISQAESLNAKSRIKLLLEIMRGSFTRITNCTERKMEEIRSDNDDVNTRNLLLYMTHNAPYTNLKSCCELIKN